MILRTIPMNCTLFLSQLALRYFPVAAPFEANGFFLFRSIARSANMSLLPPFSVAKVPCFWNGLALPWGFGAWVSAREMFPPDDSGRLLSTGTGGVSIRPAVAWDPKTELPDGLTANCARGLTSTGSASAYVCPTACLLVYKHAVIYLESNVGVLLSLSVSASLYCFSARNLLTYCASATCFSWSQSFTTSFKLTG